MNVRRIALVALLSWGTAALADTPSPEKLARIQAEQSAAQERIRIKYGNRKSTEMDREERRQLLEDERAAALQVLDKHGVTAKEFARASSRMSRDDQSRVTVERKSLEQKQPEKPEKPSAGGGGGEVAIEYGNGGDADEASTSRGSSKGSKSKGGKSSKQRRR